MLPITQLCIPGNIRKNGTSLVFIQYCHNSKKRTLINTGIAIPLKYWNKKSHRVSDAIPADLGEASKLNQQRGYRGLQMINNTLLHTPRPDKKITATKRKRHKTKSSNRTCDKSFKT